MRALLTSAALAVSLAACAARPAPVALTAQPEVDVPLSARLFPPQYGQLAVGLNKPGFVAIFEVVPGRGASLVYPTGGTGFTSMQETWVPLRYNPQRWLYTSGSRYGAFGYAGFNSGWASAYPTNGGPRYFFMVASEDPIAVEQFQEGASSVRRYLGVSYDSYQPYEVMEELAYALLPYAADERWVTDVVVDWGYDWGYGYGPMAAYSYASWERVRCADGSVRMARYVSGWGYTNLPCALATQPPPGLPIDPDRPGTPGDSVGDGRTRVPEPSDEPRTRQRAGPIATADRDMSDEEVRHRIAQLREDAMRTRFSRELDTELRRSIGTRRTVDRLMGRNGLAGEGARTVRTSPSPAADEAYRRAEASRPRERSARPGQPTRTTAGAPRSRSGSDGSARPSSSGSSERSTRASSGSSGSSGSSERSRSGGSASSGSSGGGSGSARPSSSSGGSSSSGSSSSGSSSGSSSSGGRSRIPPA